MKKVFPPFCIIFFLVFSCHNGAQNDAAKTMEAVKEAQEKYSPGMIPTTAEGYTMTAKINGKEWAAESMYPPSFAGRISGNKGKESIGLPYSSSRYKVGQTEKFHPGNVVDLFTDDEVGIWGGNSGQMQITKVGDRWIEGTFYFTATTSQDTSKSLPVTDGFFRIPVE